MGKMIVTVGFLAGTSIREAIEEAKAKSKAWNVASVCFSFNGVEMSVNRYDSTEELLREYRERRIPKIKRR